MAEDGSVVIDVRLNTEKADKDLARMNAKIDKLEDSLETKRSRKGFLTDALKEDYAKLDEAQAKVRELKAELSIAKDSATKNDIRERLADAADEQRQLTSATGKMQAEYDRLTQQIAEGETNLVKMKTTAGTLARQIERQRPFDNIAQSIEAAKGKLLKFVKYAIGIRTAYVLFRKLKSAISESVRAFAAQDKETQTTINNLKASLEALKLSWGAAFAPILNAIAPLLQTLIGWLTAAANAVARFIAILSGRSTYKKAVANNNSLASSMQGVGSAAKEAKKQLMGFDELNILQDDSSSGGGGGGASGAQLVEEAIDAFDGSFLSSLALTVKDVLFTWKDLNPEQIAEKIITGLAGVLGLALGITLVLSPGGVLMLTIAGVGLGLIASSLIFDHDGKISTKEILSMVVMALSGLAGGIIGFSVGGIPGALIGVIIGGGIGLILSNLMFGSGVKIDKTRLLNMLIIALGGVVGGVIGFTIGGVPGALLGATIGIVLSLAVTKFLGGEEAGETLGDKVILGLQSIGEKLTNWFDTKVKPWFSAEKWRTLGQDAMNSIRNGLNSIQLPKFHFSWGRASYNYNFFGKTGTVSIPYPNIDWYARGGVFDTASLIGVGEAGKEAVVPLEKNTEWITIVADGIADRLTGGSFIDKLTDAFLGAPYPAMASGSVVPPNSSLSGFSGGVSNSIMEQLDAISDALSLLASQPLQVSSKLYMDRREVGKAVTEYQRSADRANG